MQNYKNKRVFISGGAGVIGSELVRRLHVQGAHVFVGDLKPRPVAFPPAIRYRQGDLNEISREELLEFDPDYYFHLAAAFERSEETLDFWEENYRHNVQLSHYLIDCLKEAKTLRRVLFASSYLIYDPALYSFSHPADLAVSLNELSPIRPRNLCGIAKLHHEQELKFLQHFSGGKWTAVCARIFRSYGRNSRDVISRWIRSLLKGESIEVYAPEGMFDFVFADDVAEGLERLGLTAFSGVINLGSGKARTVTDVLRILGRYFPQMQWSVHPAAIPFEASEADMELFRQAAGWAPSMRLEEAIPHLIEYEQARYKESTYGN